MTAAKQMQIIHLICLILPIIILGYITLSTQHKQTSGKLWHVEITGYDPRDLLHGRYIRYQLNWSKYGKTPQTKEALCLISGATDTTTPIISSDQQNCASIIKAGKNPENWNYRGRRYQIPEKYADALDDAFADSKNKFSVDLHVHNGKIYIGDLYMNGSKVKENYGHIQSRYNDKNSTKFEAQEFTAALKNLRPYVVTDTQVCVSYEIDWARHGLIYDLTTNTPDLCLPRQANGHMHAMPASDDTQSCTARLNAGSWQSTWNYPFETFCRNNRHGQFLLDQYKQDPAAFTAQISTNANETLYVKELMIHGVKFNDAFNAEIKKQ